MELKHVPGEDETIPGALDGIRIRQLVTASRVDAVERRLGTMETLLTENTAITRDIRDAMVASRLITRVIRWLGGLALAGSAIYAAWYQFLHRGQLP